MKAALSPESISAIMELSDGDFGKELASSLPYASVENFLSGIKKGELHRKPAY